jgi:hypothetical protein
MMSSLGNSLAVFSVAHNNLSGKTLEKKYQFETFNKNSYEGNLFFYVDLHCEIIVMKKNHHGSQRIMMNKKMIVS